MLLGRASCEAFSKVWPDLTEFADGKDSVHPGYKAMPKYVVSTTLTDDLFDNWGETIILRSLDEVAALKETEGGPIINYLIRRPVTQHRVPPSAVVVV